MGLVKCIDCGKMFSDRIESCPECGCPKDFAIRDNKTIKKDNDKSKNEIMDKRKYLTNEELMSSIELKDFAFKSVFEIIEKEIGVGKLNIQKTDGNIDEVDYYLTNENINIGLDIIVNVAPSKATYVYNEEHAKKCLT